jgi:hypothetical protein
MHAFMHPPDPQFIANFAWSWSESQWRQVLRPHWEDRRGITGAEEINLREQVDGTMEWLLALELACSTGYLDLADTRAQVTYKYPAWFDDLGCYAASPGETQALGEAREIFLQAGSLACNWIRKTPLEPATPVRNCPLVWNQVFYEEWWLYWCVARRQCLQASGMAAESRRLAGVHPLPPAVYQIAADAESDPDLTFGSLGNVIRMCEADFGARIDIDVTSIRKHPDTAVSTSHCAVGTSHYDDGTIGYLIYMKSSLAADAETAVLEYKASHPDFPHETTADQFFSDDQFESYRRLGRSVAARTFRDINPSAPFLDIAENLCNLWTPNLTQEDKFVGHARALTELWSRLQSDPNLHFLGHELFARLPASPPPHPDQLVAAFYYYRQVIQLMENVFLELQLDNSWHHPDNAGWKHLFQLWADCATFQSVWRESQMTCGIRFRLFCQRFLGLP